MAVAAVVFAVLVLFIPRLTAVSLQKGFLEQDGDCSIYNYEEHQYGEDKIQGVFSLP